MNATEVKRLAREFGADLVGIAPIGRLEQLPAEQHPRTVFPNTKSVIVIGHRVLRGAFRGVEEGTSFDNTYGAFGNRWAEYCFLTRTAYEVACRLERAGIEALPLLSRSGEAGQAFVPNVAAFAKAAGLGDVGKGGFFLTPEYGHRQRFAVILTDAEFEADAEQNLTLCEGCEACVAACPLGAMSAESHAIDFGICAQCRNGASRDAATPEGVDRLASACGRACMVALENKIGSRFAHTFRKRSVWRIGVHGKGENA